MTPEQDKKRKRPAVLIPWLGGYFVGQWILSQDWAHRKNLLAGLIAYSLFYLGYIMAQVIIERSKPE